MCVTDSTTSEDYSFSLTKYSMIWLNCVFVCACVDLVVHLISTCVSYQTNGQPIRKGGKRKETTLCKVFSYRDTVLSEKLCNENVYITEGIRDTFEKKHCMATVCFAISTGSAHSKIRRRRKIWNENTRITLQNVKIWFSMYVTCFKTYIFRVYEEGSLCCSCVG